MNVGQEHAPPPAPGDELTQLRHGWLLMVLTRATSPHVKQAVLEPVTDAGRRTSHNSWSTDG